MQCSLFNSAVLKQACVTAQGVTVLSMLSLCDWMYSHADVLFIEVLFDLKQMHCTIAQSRMQC